MNRFLLLPVLFVAACTSYVVSANTFLRYGAGTFNSAEKQAFETKVASVGYRSRIIGPIFQQVEFGLWSDSAGAGRRSSGFGNYSLGIQSTPGYMVFRSSWGVGMITTPDSMLGGHFQFNQDLTVGVRDDAGTIFGFNYKHISSAGIYKVNRGRDFITVHLEIPF